MWLMKDLIIQKLKEIEQTENIRILHAVESGSRAWGFPSPDSDYDVRFIYIRPPEFYLKLEKTRDVIELPINDMLDINGGDDILSFKQIDIMVVYANILDVFCNVHFIPLVFYSVFFKSICRCDSPRRSRHDSKARWGIALSW